MNDPILCSGNDLLGVLAGIRERKCCPDRLETGVGGKNANYHVSYFEINGIGKSQESPARALASVSHLSPGKVRAGPLPSEKSNGNVTFPHQGETPAQDIALRAVKSEVAPRDPIVDPESLVKGQPHTQCDGAETVGVEDSIETRMSALQTRLAASGKLKRSKPSTKNEHARLPYSD